jgi:DNA-binding IclR family transcriptional regulator
MKQTDESPQNQVLVIDKAVRLLEEFRSADTLTLTDLSERLGMSKSTVHRLLSSLEQVGFVSKERQPGCYRLGLKLFELGSLVQARLELRQIAHPYLAQLVHDTDETSFLMIRDALHGVCIERIDGSHVQSLVLKIGGSLPLHAGGGTRCLLAYSPPEVLDEVLAAGPLKSFTPYTITNGVALRADVEQTRLQGYTLSYQDVTIGVAALGVPVFDHRNVAVGALSLSGITPRWTEAHMAEVLAAVRKAAQQISLKMGWQPPNNVDSAPLATSVSRMTSALRRMDTRT